MTQDRFQANLSLEASQIMTLLLHLSDTDPFEKEVKNKFAGPALYGISDIIGTGAVKVHCHPDAVGTLQENLPRSLAGTIDGSDWQSAFDVEGAAQLIGSACPSIEGETALKLSMLISDLAISARRRRALLVHHTEVDNLKQAHDALIKSHDVRATALAAVIRGFTPIDTPSLRVSMRRLELFEKLFQEVISSREFLEYGQERSKLFDPTAWKAPDPVTRLLSARDRCLSRWGDFQAYPIVGFAVRLGANIVGKLVDKVPFLGEGLAAIDFTEYQPMIYVLPKESALLASSAGK